MMNCEGDVKVCDLRLTTVENEIKDIKEKTDSNHDAIIETTTNVANLTKAVDKQTAAIWGLVVTVVGALIANVLNQIFK